MNKKNIRIGIAPIAWSNDDLHELGANISLNSVFPRWQSGI